ncbi:hypothetical protein [Achromobacter sp. GD03932]|uniref:hypothetical protein n=1 Tax=Achromobacter sp. GD03932 TaxID=2975407 RepID=UPI00244BA5FA|nr:hypothetical protein [Achromobacter sp. GD03932]MDH1298835.1 hypothetical protein [Achromobacter sp. GD03932]
MIPDNNVDNRVVRVTVGQLRSYLELKDWFEDGKIKSVATIWHRHGDANAEVVLPFPTAKDHEQRLKEAIVAIAAAENRFVQQVEDDVGRIFANVVSVRVIHPDTRDGTIPMNDGVLLIENTRELLLSAAQSLHSKRKQFIGKITADARAYIDTLLLGQTEIGSYIVNVIAPINENPESDNQTVESVPHAQAVTQSLVAGLDALEKASSEFEGNQSLRAFDNAILSGASANMCDALLGLSGIHRNRCFEIRVAFQVGRLFETEPRTFAFDANQLETLSKASAYYKEDYVLENRRITGFVKNLSRPQGEKLGTATIQCKVDDIDRLVKVDLEGDDYHNAIRAHDQQLYVRVNGDVHIMSCSARLLRPDDFMVLDQSDLL